MCYLSRAPIITSIQNSNRFLRAERFPVDIENAHDGLAFPDKLFPPILSEIILGTLQDPREMLFNFVFADDEMSEILIESVVYHLSFITC